MKLEEGMYVRTKEGEISKIKWITVQRWEGLDNTIEASFMLENKENIEYPRDNFKASHSLIDLIEVGDYVNGHEVIEVGIEEEGYRYVELDFDKNCDELHWGEYSSLQNVDIKSVVTKEQFNSVKYEVE